MDQFSWSYPSSPVIKVAQILRVVSISENLLIACVALETEITRQIWTFVNFVLHIMPIKKHFIPTQYMKYTYIFKDNGMQGINDDKW